jgi:hypothetical protein
MLQHVFSKVVGGEREGKAYLFELFDVDVELGAKLGLRMGEGVNLVGEGPTAGGLRVSSAAFDLKFGADVRNLSVSVAEDGFEVHLAELRLVEEDFEAIFKSEGCQ